MRRSIGTGVVGFNPAHSAAYSYLNIPKGVVVEMFGATGGRGKMLAVDPSDVHLHGWQEAMVLAEQRQIDAMNFKNRAQRRKEARENRGKRAINHR
ncbi:hypothetical protein 0305phi8-36p052 [Bacillus phage 0305phi8-36]|uniref:hypothetical protein n=1 Tax=Bacillus phage 0305phi8-36 TaxID=458639 RepID=UPI00015A1F90|nr:hypothetical protein ST0305phi8-36p052 [Bacillus phage 0305phi8-36]ABS83613.1 hypothetical protein 0305phi8-36p052 [Bacillus phage 0305phi8-36]